MPEPVQDDIGYALWRAQEGKTHYSSKPLRGKGFGGVFEIVTDYRTDAYRAVYAVKLGEKIYVLHVFQKKSKKGIATPKHELDLIGKRLQIAQQMAKENNE